MQADPSPAGSNGRDGSGRFTPGNKLGRGNPHAIRAQKLRTALFEAVSEEDLRAIIEALVAEARRGNVVAAREVLDRLLGKPEPIDLIVRLEELEQVLVDQVATAGGSR